MTIKLTGLVLTAALTALPQQQTIPDLYEPGEEAVWVFEQDGARIGDHWARYDGPADLAGVAAHRFRSRVRIAVNVGTTRIEQRLVAELWTDAAGHPLRHVLEAQIGKRYSRVELTIAGGKGKARIVDGERTRELEIDVPAGAFIQANNFILYFEILLGLEPPRKDAPTRATVLSSNALRPLPYTAHWQRALTPEADGVAGSELRDSFGETIELGDDGRLIALAVPAQKLSIRRSDEQVEAFTIRPPAPKATPRSPVFATEAVEIRHGDVVLAGAITRRRDASGRLPAVFFVSGSGLQDRDGMSTAGVDVGTREILDRLTREGFLVLRVDDRGAGASKGPMADLGYDDLVADARACVDFLFRRDDVDPERIAVIGHSEGGVTAPILARERPEIAAIVLMAATGRPLLDVIYEQNVAAVDDAGLTGAERDKTLAAAKHWLQRAASAEPIDPAEVPASFRSLLGMRRWLQDHARQDPIANIERVRCPVLILQGAKDFQVSADRDARPLEAALARIEHPDHVLRVFPDLDHLFKRVKGERSQLSDYFEDRPADPAFLDALVAWLKQRLQR